MKYGFEKIVSLAKAPLSAGLILLLLFVQLLAASEALHHDVHDHDHDVDSDHECAATLLSKGHIDVSAPIVAAPIATSAIIASQLIETAPAPSNLIPFLHPSRGPPSLV